MLQMRHAPMNSDMVRLRKRRLRLKSLEPDAVVFNGYHNAYDHAPLQVKVGERVRNDPGSHQPP